MSQIRAKQLHADVSGLVILYGNGHFLSIDDLGGALLSGIENYTGYLAGSGNLINHKFDISTGVSSETFLFDSVFSGIPYVHTEIVAPNDTSSFYLSFLSDVTSSGFTANYSAILSGSGSSGFYMNVLAGTAKSVNYILDYSLTFPEMTSYLNSGNFNLKDTVRTTGDQDIFGTKNFLDDLFLSGNPVSTGQAVSVFRSGIQTGVDLQWFSFNRTFNTPPFVQTTIQMPSNGTGLYFNNISGVSSSGFYSIWTAQFQQTGYSLNVRAE